MKILRNLTLLILLCPVQLFASDEIKAKILNSIEHFAKDHRIQAVYAISARGKLIIQGAHGFCDLEENKRLTTSQIMPILSVTKQVTAAAILLLQDRGLLSVDDNIAKHLPLSSGVWGTNKLPDWANKITIHHLLSHSSGLPEYIWDSEVSEMQTCQEASSNVLKIVAKKDTEFEPGAKYQYTHTGYVILGMIIEHISGQQLGDFYKKEFFDPLDMKHTSLLSLSDALRIQKGEILEEYPVRYYAIPSRTTPKLTPVVTKISAAPNADGGLVSTAEDLVKWNEALHHGKILSKVSYNQMIKPYFKAEDRSTGYPSFAGYGIYISKLHNGKTYYHHTGSAFGVRCDAGYIPQNDVSIAILSNVMLYIPDAMVGKVDFRKPANQVDISYFRDAIFESL